MLLSTLRFDWFDQCALHASAQRETGKSWTQQADKIYISPEYKEALLRYPYSKLFVILSHMDFIQSLKGRVKASYALKSATDPWSNEANNVNSNCWAR